MTKNNFPIDFVITWVDGNDPFWIEEKNKYYVGQESDNRDERFRNWDNLMYLFRGIEKYANWVNKIFFVTWGHIPKWLNTDNPKLIIVRHEDFMPLDALPCFNGCALEVNLHRIPGLSEYFVYFNDDMFLINTVKRTDFFKNGLPCDIAALSCHCYSEETWFHFAAFRHVGVVNKYFNMKDVIKNNWKKWFNFRYSISNMLQTMILSKCPRFPGFWPSHLPQAFLKKTFNTVWEKEEDKLNIITRHRFRDMLDMHQWLFKDWQLCEGQFEPVRMKGKVFELRHGVEPAIEAAKVIKRRRYQMICLNDGQLTKQEYIESKEIINEAFNFIFPDKCSFEVEDE